MTESIWRENSSGNFAITLGDYTAVVVFDLASRKRDKDRKLLNWKYSYLTPAGDFIEGEHFHTPDEAKKAAVEAVEEFERQLSIEKFSLLYGAIQIPMDD